MPALTQATSFSSIFPGFPELKFREAGEFFLPIFRFSPAARGGAQKDLFKIFAGFVILIPQIQYKKGAML